ncbi:pro-opiomelanocortin isoform X1 [Nothobranchius furzeri]|uniref:Pro-opiomelanocortin-like n=3 Tax=Nothobranchius furzeri TaxID=105023 RepID=A0A9D2Z3D3_NOTFU|nr:pro-opiomelanocortin-like [Nothobranchius furzeri]
MFLSSRTEFFLLLNFLCTQLEMVRLCWLLLAFTCSSGFGSTCLDSAVCSQLSNKDQILDCVHLCMSVIQTEIPDLSESAQQIHDDDNLLLTIFLSTLVPEDKPSDGNTHSDQRRSYSMEHFRWGKANSRKLRPVKVFSSLEGGGSPASGAPFRAYRHLLKDRSVALDANHLNQDLLGSRVTSGSGLPRRKFKPYRMSHFRWGNPPAAKPNNRFMKSWEEKPQEKLDQYFQNTVVKSIQRIMA